MIINFKKIVKQNTFLKNLYLFVTRHNIFKFIIQFQVIKYFKFLIDFIKFKKNNKNFAMLYKESFPILYEFNSSVNPIDYQYFYQFYWALDLIKKNNFDNHLDIGSQIQFTGILSMFKKVTFLDIRKLNLELPNLNFLEGSVTDLPFQKNSLFSVSILHVFEHLGLGRYGEKLDSTAYKKAANELSRVITDKGKLYISTTIGNERIQFNAQIVFSPNTILEIFNDFELLSFSLVDSEGKYFPKMNINNYKFNQNSGNDFELGMFEFEKK